MSRRCKPGQRARIISGSNQGAIVVVVRHYFGEKIGGATWPRPIFPWVVCTLGAPLKWHKIHDPSICGTATTVVRDDSELQPLDNDDDGLARNTDEPVRRRKGAPVTGGVR